MDERFIRNIMYWGVSMQERLAAAHVAVVGIGGVGGYAAEALARAGVGRLTLIDSNVVSVSNLNRQITALGSTVGRPKAEVMAERVRDINPDAQAEARVALYSAENRETVLFDCHYDYIVDAIDLVSCKLDLICSAMERGIPVISALGTGNKHDPSQFRVEDIAKTKGCPFARVVRRELRSRGILHHRVVYSPERAVAPLELEAPPPGRRSVPASLPWVPPTAGLMLAGAVVSSLCGLDRTERERKQENK